MLKVNSFLFSKTLLNYCFSCCFSFGFFWLSLLSPHQSLSQEYPYEEKAAKKQPSNALPQEDIPVESPEDLEKAGKFQKRTSIFRMAIKGGGNFSYFQFDAQSVSGFGAEGRLAFGWDMAFQPIYLETEFGYRGQNLSTKSPVHVAIVQQGLYYRERLGKTTLWKPGLLSTLDFRIEPIDATTKQTTVFPSIGLTSLWEFGPVLFQISGYIHRIGNSRSFLSSAVLAGLKF